VTPLEAARRLANDPMESAGCSYCGATSQQTYRGRGDWCHLLSCPTRALPRIVAALEAAERVADARFAAWCAHADVITDLVDALRDEVPSP
jgi:hypothetical protein